MRTMLACTLLLATASAPRAQSDVRAFPSKPVRLIVPFAPGGSSEIIGRLLGHKLTEIWKHPVIIDNRPGAGGALGAELAARAQPDGYTLIFANPGPALHNIVLRRKPPYTFTDFAPVAYLGYSPTIIVVTPKLPIKNARDLIAFAKANPGKLNWATAGVNSNPHISMEMFKAATGTEVVHVPYKGAGQGLTDMVAGQVHAQYASIASAEAFFKTARVRVIGISGAQRQAALPDVETFTEQGIRGIDALLWFGIQTAAQTPRAVVAILNAGIEQALAAPDLRARLKNLGVDIEGGPPERFSGLIKSEAARLAPLIQSGALQLE